MRELSGVVYILKSKGSNRTKFCGTP